MIYIEILFLVKAFRRWFSVECAMFCFLPNTVSKIAPVPTILNLPLPCKSEKSSIIIIIIIKTQREIYLAMRVFTVGDCGIILQKKASIAQHCTNKTYTLNPKTGWNYIRIKDFLKNRSK